MSTAPPTETIVRSAPTYLILGETDPNGFDGIRLNGTGFTFDEDPVTRLPIPTGGTVTNIRLFEDGEVVLRVSNLSRDDLPTLAQSFQKLGNAPTEADAIAILQGASFKSLAAVSLTGSYGTDIFTGSNFDDYLDGDAGDDVLVGRDGDDTLIADVYDPSAFGTPGYDRLYGGNGDDRLVSYGGGDLMYGGAGNDVLSTAYDGGSRLYGGEGDDSIFDASTGYGYASVDRMYGGAGNDVITSNEGPDRIFGGAGDDAIFLASFEGGRADGGDGDDFISAAFSGDFVINGGAGNDRIAGDTGDDRINGGDGDDLIELSAGNDLVRGGAGVDTFSFVGNEIFSLDDGHTVIRDFEVGVDVVMTADVDQFLGGLVDTRRGALYTDDFGHTTLFRDVTAADVAGSVTGDSILLPPSGPIDIPEPVG